MTPAEDEKKAEADITNELHKGVLELRLQQIVEGNNSLRRSLSRANKKISRNREIHHRDLADLKNLHHRDLDDLKRKLGEHYLHIDRLNADKLARDKQINRLWTAILGGLATLIVSLILILISKTVPPS
jgi:hypothetical protein